MPLLTLADAPLLTLADEPLLLLGEGVGGPSTSPFYFRKLCREAREMKTLIHANEATAVQRRVYFHLVDATDGITAETGEAGGQPQISTNGGAWTNTGIGVLVAIGNGRYYADLTQGAVATAGDLIETRYKSANTAECPGDSIQVVAFDPADATGLGLSRLDAAVSSRMATFTYTAPDNASIGTILTRTDVATSTRLAPTTAGRTLDVTATGAAGIDWGNVENPSTTVSLSDTTIAVVGVANDLANISVAVTVGAMNAGAIDSVWEYATASITTAGGIGKLIKDNLDVAVSTRMATFTYTAPDNAGIGTLLTRIPGTVQPQTGDSYARLGAAGAGLTAIPWNANWDAEVQSEVQDAIEANHLDHLLATDYDPAAKPGVATALLNEIIGNDAGVSQFTANALELAPTGGSAPTVGQIADAVWDEVLSGHLTAGTTGNALNAAGGSGDPWSTVLPGAYGAGTAGKIIGDNLNATISSRLAPTTAGRTLDVSAAGNAGIDWANVENPATALNLSGTQILFAAGAEVTAIGTTAVETIWNISAASLSSAGSIGKLIVDMNAKVGGWTGTGINTILGAFRALANKSAALTPSDITSGGLGFDNTTDSHEALRDRGDSGAWGGVAVISGADKDDIVDRAWDELLAGHAVAGSTGKKLTDLTSGGGGGGGGGTGSGDIPITQDGAVGTTVDGLPSATDAMRFVQSGVGLDAVEVVAFLAADYSAGRTGIVYRQGTTMTKPDGRWLGPLMLNAGAYTLIGNKNGFQAKVHQLVVT